MREIKFRAWDTKEKRFFDLYTMAYDAFGVVMFHEIIYGKKTRYIPLQYTGLKDPNGKEIYEADVIEFWSYTGEDGTHIDAERYAVVWMSEFDYPAFDLDGCDHESNMLSELVGSGEWKWEVIGNIYENPELLTTNV